MKRGVVAPSMKFGRKSVANSLNKRQSPLIDLSILITVQFLRPGVNLTSLIDTSYTKLSKRKTCLFWQLDVPRTVSGRTKCWYDWGLSKVSVPAVKTGLFLHVSSLNLLPVYGSRGSAVKPDRLIFVRNIYSPVNHSKTSKKKILKLPQCFSILRLYFSCCCVATLKRIQATQQT